MLSQFGTHLQVQMEIEAIPMHSATRFIAGVNARIQHNRAKSIFVHTEPDGDWRQGP